MSLDVLLAAYGGGHAEIIAEVAKALTARGDNVRIIGFTTGYQALLNSSLPAESVEALLDYEADAPYIEAVAPLCAELPSHPTVSPEQTKAYFALGLRDLVLEYGWQEARSRIRKDGRKAFLPVDSLQRFLRAESPHIVISTTSPRFELALHKAARRLSIPSLAIGDLFLRDEKSWITDTDYAPYLAVLCDEVRDEIVASGFASDRVRVTGNPAFDSLAVTADDRRHRQRLRRSLGLHDKRVVLWPAAGGTVSNIGRPFTTVDEFVAAIEPACHRDPSLRYVIRPHPNSPFVCPDTAVHGLLDNGLLTVKEAIMVSDIVCFDISTMGLQAALCGKPAISIGFSDYLPFVDYGLAHNADTLREAITLIESNQLEPETRFRMPPLGSACRNVLAFVDDILREDEDKT